MGKPVVNVAKDLTVPDSARPRAVAEALHRDTLREGAVVFGGLFVLSIAAASWGRFSDWYEAKALLIFVLVLGLAWPGLRTHHPHARFGPANRVTLARLGLMALLAACLGEALHAPWLVWALVVLATVAAVLDAADGPLARRSGLASAFGARFDMEIDALLTLVLCLLLVQEGKAGAWVLAAGLMRYAFVAAAWALPWLNAPLPPSWRRKAVCVTQITTLIVCLGPVIAPWASNALAALALAMLSWSFAVDIHWLHRHRPRRG